MEIKRRKGKLNKAKKKRGKDLGVEAKKQRAIEMRRDGYSYPMIGKALGVSGVQAWRYVQKELDNARKKTFDKVERLRMLELLRLDNMLKPLRVRIKKGDTEAIHAAVKLMDRRARYIIGLNVPQERKLGFDEEFYKRARETELGLYRKLQVMAGEVDEIEIAEGQTLLLPKSTGNEEEEEEEDDDT